MPDLLEGADLFLLEDRVWVLKQHTNNPNFSLARSARVTALGAFDTSCSASLWIGRLTHRRLSQLLQQSHDDVAVHLFEEREAFDELEGVV